MISYSLIKNIMFLGKMTHVIAEHVTSVCSETREEHMYLVRQLLMLCDTKDCVKQNMQRMKNLCGIRKVGILQFKASIGEYSSKYDLTLKDVFEQLMKCWGISIEQIKDKYARSENAQRFINNIKTAERLLSFDNKSFQVLFDVKNKHRILSKNDSDATDMNLLVDKIPVDEGTWSVRFEIAFYDADDNVVNEDELILKEFNFTESFGRSDLILSEEFITYVEYLFDNQLEFQGETLELGPPQFYDVHLYIE